MSEPNMSEISRDDLLYYMSLDIARDNMGIHPQSWTDNNGVTTKRTPEQEAHNKCLMRMTENRTKAHKMLKSCPPELFDLIRDDESGVSISLWGDGPTFEVNCNDLFWWACADAEELTLEEIPDLLRALEESPKFGTDLWVARKREMRPQDPYYSYFTPQETELFNACGPERAKDEQG